jgi:hypothetical protein
MGRKRARKSMITATICLNNSREMDTAFSINCMNIGKSMIGTATIYFKSSTKMDRLYTEETATVSGSMNSGPIANSTLSSFNSDNLEYVLKGTYDPNMLSFETTTDNFGQYSIEESKLTYGLMIYGENADDIVLRNKTAINLLSYFMSGTNTLNINFYTTFAMFSLYNTSTDTKYTTYESYIESHIEQFGLRDNNSELTVDDAINIYENELAALYDAKISFLANIAHGLASGTWAKMLELIQEILDDDTRTLDLNSTTNKPGSVYDIIDKWSEDAGKKNMFNLCNGNDDSLACYSDQFRDIFVSVYDTLMANETGGYKSHAITANMWHPYPDVSDDTTSSFIASDKSIINALNQIYKNYIAANDTEYDVSFTWIDNDSNLVDFNNLIYNATYVDEGVVYSTYNLWLYICNTYNYTSWNTLADAEDELEPDLVDEDDVIVIDDVEDITGTEYDLNVYCVPSSENTNNLIIITDESDIDTVVFPSYDDIQALTDFTIRLVNDSSKYIVITSDSEIKLPGNSPCSETTSGMRLPPNKTCSWVFIVNQTNDDGKYIVFDYLGDLPINIPSSSNNDTYTIDSSISNIYIIEDPVHTVYLDSNDNLSIGLINNIDTTDDFYTTALLSGIIITSIDPNEKFYCPYTSDWIPSDYWLNGCQDLSKFIDNDFAIEGSSKVILPKDNSITFIKVDNKWIGINSFNDCINTLSLDLETSNQEVATTNCIYICNGDSTNASDNAIILSEVFGNNTDIGFINNTNSRLKIQVDNTELSIKEGLDSIEHALYNSDTINSIVKYSTPSSLQYIYLPVNVSIVFRYIKYSKTYYILS